MPFDRHVLIPLVTGENGRGRGFRLEIDEFIADNEMTNLFLVALSEMQKNSLRTLENGEPDWLTYYSLSGIHGLPKDAWNGYKNDQAEGYCHHSANTFPTWHRPYMMLFESALHQEMVKQANLYTGKDQQVYLDAAARFRLPYWDILMPRRREPLQGKDKAGNPTAEKDWKTVWACPELLKVKKVFVKLPKGDGFSEIDNPMASFTFPTEAEFLEYEKKTGHTARNRLKYLPQDHFNSDRTARVPTDKSKGETDDDAVDLAIQRQAVATATSLWQLLHPTKKTKHLYEEGTNIDLTKINGLDNEDRSWGLFANNLHVAKPPPPKKEKPSEGYNQAQGEEENTAVDKAADHKYALVSLESFHDGIHDLLGTGLRLDHKDGETPYTGQMGDPKFAAFDPIFWMHHNNIERLLCLQQALHPDEWTSEDENQTELYPFMTGNDRKCFKSDDSVVENYWSSGFSIPGERPFPDYKGARAAELQKLIAKYLSATYYWATTLGPHGEPEIPKDWPKTKNIEASWALRGDKAAEHSSPNPTLHMSVITLEGGEKGEADIAVRDVDARTGSFVKEDLIRTDVLLKTIQSVHEKLPPGALLSTGSTTGPQVQVTWNAHIRVRKFAFNKSFSVHLFLGHPDDHKSGSFMTEENQAGFMGIFVSDEEARCAQCDVNRENDVIVEDVVPLTGLLYEYLTGAKEHRRDEHTIPDLTPNSVVPFLKEHLSWRMIDLQSKLLKDQELHAGLVITVTSRQYLGPTEEHLMGVYGSFTEHPDITAGRKGGAGTMYAF